MERFTCPFVATLVGIFFLIVGGGLAWFGVKRISSMRANEILILGNDTNTQKRWIQPTKPSIIKLYVFNVTNAEEVKKGSKPRLRPMGPYIFEYGETKVQLLKQGDSELSYRLKTSVEFDDEDSEPWLETDEVTVVNVPLANALVGDYGANAQFAPDFDNLLIKTTVKELLFDGIAVRCSENDTYGFLPCKNLENHPSRLIRRDGKDFKFSFFHMKNGIQPHLYGIDTGRKNVKNAGQIKAVDRNSMLKIWRDSYCNRINGSDGSQFPKMLNKEDKLYLYDGDLCRSIYIEFEEVVEDEGIELFRYVITKNLFMSEGENPENGCFCRSSKSGGKKMDYTCLGTGVLSLFPCLGSSLVVSLPFFYLGDEKYGDYSGLIPHKQDHETYFEIEPTFGITVTSCKRFQMNVEVPKVRNNETVDEDPEVFPVFWSEEKTYLSEEFYDVLRYRLFEKTLMEYGTLAVLALGFLLVLVPYPAHKIVHEMCREEADEEDPFREDRSESKDSREDETETDKIISLWETQRRNKLDRSLEEEMKMKPSKTLKIDNFM